MKKYILILSFICAGLSLKAQGLKGFMNKVSKDSSSKPSIGKAFGFGENNRGLSSSTIANGLKEALETGTQRGVEKLSSADGFFKDAAIKILIPEEAKKAESTLRGMGMGAQVDNAILSMNRAAEDASKSAAPIFLNAIKQMTIQDAAGILKGGDFAATDYLKAKQLRSLPGHFAL